MHLLDASPYFCCCIAVQAQPERSMRLFHIIKWKCSKGVNGLKKILCIVLTLVMLFAMPLTVLAASVVPVEYPGNDANPADYTPPEGCVRTTLPDSDVVGTHVYRFNGNGVLDPSGTNIFTLVVGIEPGTEYTQVLSWEWDGSYDLFAVIVKGGPAFNLYEYGGTATSDTNLVSPVTQSGFPADISHVSVVLCPDGEPPVPPDGVEVCCIIIIILLVLMMCLLIAILIMLVHIYCIICRKKSRCRPKKPKCCLPHRPDDHC